MASPQENYKQFEKLGEEKVQENLALGLFRSDKALAAEHWLTQRSRRQRWSRFLRQPAKVDSLMQRTIHHEDAETVFRGVQGQGGA